MRRHLPRRNGSENANRGEANMPARDKRYKVTPAIVRRMRVMRRGGLTYQRIADSFGVSYFTAYYWTNDGYRADKRRKNAQRTYTPAENPARAARDAAKRKANWVADPEMKLRHEIQSAKGEKRSVRRTVQGMPMSEAEELLKSGKLNRRNQKLDL